MADIDRRVMLRAGGLVALGGLLAGCGRQGHDGDMTDFAPPTLAPLEVRAARMQPGADVTAGSRLAAFAAALFESDAFEETANAAISPYSIYSALAMTAAGARGETAQQFTSLLGGDASAAAGLVTAIDKSVADAVAAGRADDEHMAVDPANTVVLQRDLAVHEEFLKQLATGFAAGMQKADFAGKPDDARSEINRWVSERTHALIPQLLARGTITSSTRLVLVNALYLKAKWSTQFKSPVGKVAFTAADGTKTTTPMMNATASYSVAKGENWQSVRIPYLGGRLAMTIVLPGVGAFQAVRRQLASVLPRATGSQPPQQLVLSMPPFSLDTAEGLVPALAALGLRDVFDPRFADLSGMAGKPGDLFAAEVQHQAVVKVDQHGTEAAAATAVGMAARAMRMPPPEQFIVDRAFFFAIHDATTGAPLFLGQVSRPEQ